MRLESNNLIHPDTTIKANMQSFESVWDKERSDKEDDYVDVIYTDLTTISSLTADLYIAHPDIDVVKNRNHLAQRLIINSYFREIISRYSAYNNFSIEKVTRYILDEGDAVDWINHIRTYVIPFLEKTNAIEFLSTIKDRHE